MIAILYHLKYKYHLFPFRIGEHQKECRLCTGLAIWKQERKRGKFCNDKCVSNQMLIQISFFFLVILHSIFLHCLATVQIQFLQSRTFLVKKNTFQVWSRLQTSMVIWQMKPPLHCIAPRMFNLFYWKTFCFNLIQNSWCGMGEYFTTKCNLCQELRQGCQFFANQILGKILTKTSILMQNWRWYGHKKLAKYTGI